MWFKWNYSQNGKWHKVAHITEGLAATEQVRAKCKYSRGRSVITLVSRKPKTNCCEKCVK